MSATEPPHLVAVKLAIMDSERPPTSAEVSLVELSQADRVTRALKRLLIFWGLAPLVFISFVPIVHLLGTLALLVLGPILSFVAYRTTVLIAGGSIDCPKCTRGTAVKEHTPGWPARMFCSHCGTTFYASRA